jgi:hypothetical protein
MNKRLLMGLSRYMLPIPRVIWQGQVVKDARNTEAGLGFMAQEHHRVRNLVVEELPRVGQALAPDFIAQKLDLPVARVNHILDELERHMTFLFRNKAGAVAWAYPVTVDVTPHHVTFSTGEQVYAA